MPGHFIDFDNLETGATITTGFMSFHLTKLHAFRINKTYSDLNNFYSKGSLNFKTLSLIHRSNDDNFLNTPKKDILLHKRPNDRHYCLLATWTRLIIFLIWLIGSSSETLGQQIKYHVVKGDKDLGAMVVDYKIEHGKEYYKIRSTVNFRILFSFTVKFWQEEYFEDGILVSGSSYSKLNGRMQKESSVQKIGDRYILKLDGLETTNSVRNVEYSISKLYTSEPRDKKFVFSQSFGRYLPIEKIGPHKYQLESPDGINYYTYENGICIEVKVSRDFATFYFRLQEENLVRARETH